MSNEPLTRPDSAQEFPREIESYSRVRPSHPRVQSFVVGRLATAQEIDAFLGADDRTWAAGEPFEKDLNVVDWAVPAVQTRSLQMTYQPKKAGADVVTIPFERSRALVETKLFLLELTDPKVMPRLPRAIRGKARSLLKHYPTYADIEQAHKALPDTYGPVPPFSRLTGSPQTVATIEASTHHDDGTPQPLGPQPAGHRNMARDMLSLPSSTG